MSGRSLSKINKRFVLFLALAGMKMACLVFFIFSWSKLDLRAAMNIECTA